VSFVVHSSSRELSVDEVRALPRSTTGTCWNGAVLPSPLAWSVAVDSHALWFVCELPGGRVCTSQSSHGEFVEGLWNEDVAELFIKGEGGAYQELNLAPSGAWWSMTLSEYRSRVPVPQRPHPRHISTAISDARWEVVAAFDRDTLDVPLLPSSRIHVSGMWYRPEPCYLSSNPPSGRAPDYHHDDCFEAVSFVSRA
jgi:hypothetical protein